ncbi:putative oberon, PHD finger domain-containing protein [Lupinus albus]|uniref:Putative oberon, PHD finger domain-containing protein n=1 Tax=Lupinus albus TaxID=3870 RepID=A0A6A4PHT8_LUPAL|nr:putative oberon, PHD finger domain-containing protein [Lupinus albus]
MKLTGSTFGGISSSMMALFRIYVRLRSFFRQQIASRCLLGSNLLICHLFDDNKDPSLWVVCTSESTQEGSCGLSCHIECALQHEKAGVVDHGQLMQLDGGYCCASCGTVTGILGCWKKQLVIVKDARRVDVLNYRIYLRYRLLDGTSKFKELHQIVVEAKAKLETEVGPFNGVSAKMARGIVSRLSIASDMQNLCSLAIEKADSWLATVPSVNPDFTDGSLIRST